jgi:5-methylcytosine-specific restriction endonuclease McrBC GTP-binding regulatory subunit McrB
MVPQGHNILQGNNNKLLAFTIAILAQLNNQPQNKWDKYYDCYKNAPAYYAIQLLLESDTLREGIPIHLAFVRRNELWRSCVCCWTATD